MKNPFCRALSFITCCVLLFSSCNENTVDPVFYGNVNGTVTYLSSGAPAAGVEVSTIPATTTILTNAQGNFALTDVATGGYSVIASIEGYKNATYKVVVSRDKSVNVNLQLEHDTSTPASPQIAFPAQGAENIDRFFTLKWSIDEKNNDPLNFDVVLFESNVNEPVLDLENITDTLTQVTNLKFNTTYYWQVNAKNSSGTVTYGELWHFRTLPFPDNRYVFSTQRDGNYEIYSSDETGSNLVRLTYSDKDQVYPQYSNDRNFIAYAEFTDLAYHLYIMKKDGTSPIKVTTLPLAGFHNDGRGFCWSPDNGKLLYAHYDKLYSIERDGSNLSLIATAPAGRNFRACDWTGQGNRIVVETVGVLPFQTEIRLIDLANATDDEIISDEAGTIQSPSFSIDGNLILFTHDVSGFESETGRQLDSRPFLYNLTTTNRTDLSKDKVSGTNDLHPRYSPDGAKIILENSSNDGSGIRSVYVLDLAEDARTKLFDDAGMPHWQ